MTIWKLTPIRLDARDWEASTYRGEVIARGSSEEEARNLASKAFLVATSRTVGKRVRLSPWKQPDLVACAELKESDYNLDGEPEILEPT